MRILHLDLEREPQLIGEGTHGTQGSARDEDAPDLLRQNNRPMVHVYGCGAGDGEQGRNQPMQTSEGMDESEAAAKTQQERRPSHALRTYPRSNNRRYTQKRSWITRGKICERR